MIRFGRVRTVVDCKIPWPNTVIHQGLEKVARGFFARTKEKRASHVAPRHCGTVELFERTCEWRAAKPFSVRVQRARKAGSTEGRFLVPEGRFDEQVLWM